MMTQEETDNAILEDSDLLDVVRRMRSYMVTLDNVHHVLTQVQNMEDSAISNQAISLLNDVPNVNLKVSQLLRLIEASKQYRNMIKKYNLEDSEDS